MNSNAFYILLGICIGSFSSLLGAFLAFLHVRRKIYKNWRNERKDSRDSYEA
jgi:uncharacterized membrane protein YdjX (TVP38/TMEM64 family)